MIKEQRIWVSFKLKAVNWLGRAFVLGQSSVYSSRNTEAFQKRVCVFCKLSIPLGQGDRVASSEDACFWDASETLLNCTLLSYGGPSRGYCSHGWRKKKGL